MEVDFGEEDLDIGVISDYAIEGLSAFD